MVPKCWADEDQLKFLNEKVDAYMEAQKTKRYDQFWTDLKREWFQRWKEDGQDIVPTPENAEEHRRQLGERLENRIKVGDSMARND